MAKGRSSWILNRGGFGGSSRSSHSTRSLRELTRVLLQRGSWEVDADYGPRGKVGQKLSLMRFKEETLHRHLAEEEEPPARVRQRQVAASAEFPAHPCDERETLRRQVQR